MANLRGSTRPGANGAETSLDAAMRAPSTNVPDVVVLESVDDEVTSREVVDPNKDLWLSTVDGRYQSPIIPVRCGPHAETFHVHLEILRKSEYFRKALDGLFREAADQAIDLPEEDPTNFSFVVAFLYEGIFRPIKPIASVLVEDQDKGKGKEIDEGINSGSEDGTESGASGSDATARSRRRRENRRRREDRVWEERRRKVPGRHRPDCNCASCITELTGPPCWNCGVSRRPPHPRNMNWANGIPPPPPPPPAPVYPPGFRPTRRHRDQQRRRGSRNNMPATNEPVDDARMSTEDLRTWSLAYSLSIDVYVCAEKYLMQDFKECIARLVINNFEIAGLDAAVPSVLESCKTLLDGVSQKDPLLKKIFARVGFLQGRLWIMFPEETHNFLVEHAEISTLIMREMAQRREDDLPGLPAMEPPTPPASEGHVEVEIIHVPRRRYDY